MNTNSTIANHIKSLFPKLFVTEIVDNNLTFNAEKDNGFIEYKRTLVACDDKKAQQYATQMRWRITENIRHQCATYFIGIDDDGGIIGLSDNEIIECITCFVTIANLINASITAVQLIHIYELTIIKIGVKIKKIQDDYYIEFGDKF